jgi:ABC-2 type transport system permease protein
MTSSFGVSSQLAAIAEVQWRMFVNVLRGKRGKLELLSRILLTTTLGILCLGGFAAAVGSAWYLVSHDEAEYLAIPLWSIFFFWQIFPIMSTTFANNPDSSGLLRFPLAYRSFFIVRLTYGFFDASSILGCAFVFGVLLGIGAARPFLIPWAMVALATFALFNLVLMQAVYAWIERWLAQRRTREIFGVLFILTMLSFQVIGPILERVRNRRHREINHALNHAIDFGARAQVAFPPGMVARAVAKMSHGDSFSAFIALLALIAATLIVGWILHLRLRAQFRGENLSEVSARPARTRHQPLPLGWDLPGLSQSVAAVFEKEVHYLLRSGPMLLSLVMPVFVLVVFRLGPMTPLRAQRAFSGMPDLIFPGAAAYTLLLLTNIVFNSFGGDGGGIQFFYASPVRFRHIFLGKNLLHASVLMANVSVAWIVVSWFYGMPRLAVTLGTIAGLLFAAPLIFAVGNLLSVYFPKKRDFSTFGRQNASQTTVLISLGLQAVIIGLGVGVFAMARMMDNLWLAPLCFGLLAAFSIPAYGMILRRLGAIAIERRETMLEELCRA